MHAPGFACFALRVARHRGEGAAWANRTVLSDSLVPIRGDFLIVGN